MVVKKWANGDRYEGDWNDGMKNGEGILYYANGGKYDGSWSDNMRDGFGVNTWADGNTYEGYWKDNKREGQGTLTYPDGGKYIGEWEDNMRSGQGVNTWSDGRRYKGSWSENKMFGQGTLTYPDGGKYVGEWEDDMRQGEGVNRWSNGNQYEGSWAGDKQHGHGIFVYSDGGKYDGEWAESMRDGYGINTWPNGDRYEGSWSYNKKQGKGTFYHADGRKEVGNWTNDKIDGQHSKEVKKNNVKPGDRKFNAKNAMQVTGMWLNNQPFLVMLVPNSSECAYLELAREFIVSLQWDKTYFDPSHNRCYCNDCYKDGWKDVIEAGEGKYVIPRGWVRLGFHIDPVLMKTQDIWNKWIVTYHGTTKIAAQSIVAHRQFCMPGDTLIDGTKLRIRPGHIPNQNFVYTSPTIAYSSSPIYSPVYDFYSNENDVNYEAQIVLHCRQMPNSFRVGPETIGAGNTQLCRHIPNSEIEYFTDRRASLVAYGLLVRFRPKSA